MNIETNVARHYATDALIDRIKDALTEMGVDLENVTPDDLKPVDEFHIGGVAATRDLIAQAEITAGMEILDLGSGLGGTPRFIARTTGCSVTGVDLTPEFVETACALSDLCGMSGQTRFELGSVLDLPFEGKSFDVATLIHVGMNIPDKPRLMREAARVLKPGGIFAVYDVMAGNGEQIDFPVPWAESQETSFLATPDEYIAAAETAGFTVISTRDRRQFALDFFANMQATIRSAGGPPPLGLHLLMGETRAAKIQNMVGNISAGRISPVELILKAPA